MNLKTIAITGSLAAVLLTVPGCTPDSEKNINAGIEKYGKKHYAEARKLLEKGLVQSATVRKTETEWRCGCSGNEIYHCRENLQFLAVHDRDIPCPNIVEDIAVREEPQQAVVTDRDSIFIYHDGELVKTVEHDDDILAVAMDAGNVYFYSDRKLYRYSLKSDNVKPAVDASFSPPSDLREYKSCLYMQGKRLILTVGIAGIYNISVINLENDDITIHNQRLATWKIQTVKDGMYVVTGSSGSWDLEKISYSGKTLDTLQSFSKLHDVHMTKAMYLAHTPGGIMFSFYDDDLHFFPFTFRIECATPDYLLVSGKKSRYLLNTSKMKKVLEELLKKTPELFEKED
mgnify:CR=1 FL=1